MTADLIVSADGPLGVQCGTCKAFLAGTTYPVTELHLRTLEALQKIHKQQGCKAVTP